MLTGLRCREAVAAQARQQAERMWNLAHLVVIVADAGHAAAHGGGLSKREVALAGSVVHEGRCLLVVLNKLDALPDGAARQQVPPSALPALLLAAAAGLQSCA